MRNFKDVGELTKRFSNFPDSYIKRTMEQVREKFILMNVSSWNNNLCVSGLLWNTESPKLSSQKARKEKLQILNASPMDARFPDGESSEITQQESVPRTDWWVLMDQLTIYMFSHAYLMANFFLV